MRKRGRRRSIRWRLWLWNYPELNYFQSDREAENALTRSFKIWWPILAFIFGTLGMFIALHYYGPQLGAIVGVVLVSTMVCVVIRLERGGIRRKLRKELANLGIPICIPCGYGLHGLTEPRCPECGQEFDPELLKSAENAEMRRVTISLDEPPAV